jgi:hypothetical protein
MKTQAEYVRDYQLKSKLVKGDKVFCIHAEKEGIVLENQPKWKRARIRTHGKTNQIYTDFYHYDNFIIDKQ